MKIRVLRVMEYTYDSVERMEMDMARWTNNIRNREMTMRSASVGMEVFDEDNQTSVNPHKAFIKGWWEGDPSTL